MGAELNQEKELWDEAYGSPTKECDDEPEDVDERSGDRSEYAVELAEERHSGTLMLSSAWSKSVDPSW